jgi:hypothetical protein
VKCVEGITSIPGGIEIHRHKLECIEIHWGYVKNAAGLVRVDVFFDGGAPAPAPGKNNL